MFLSIKRMVIDHFKGIEHREIEFEPKTKIKGQNGTGKTTCADAWLWLLTDSNYALVKNPSITPVGASECVSRVEAEIEIDDKPCTIAKSQKFKSKTDDTGKVTSSVTNTYEINSVEKSYRDFVADMTERGLDIDNFLILSHPFAFTIDNSKSGREKMRSLLFRMTDVITDLQIAEELENADDLKVLLENYRLDEIEQMQRSTIKRINETCGKDNSVINAKIDGLISSKIPGNVKELEAKLEITNKAIKSLEAEIESKSSKSYKEDIDELLRQQAAIERAEQEALEESRHEQKTLAMNVSTDLEIARAKYNTTAYETSNIEAEIKIKEKNVDVWRKKYKEIQDIVFDENETKCPTCHREYEPHVAEQIRAEFEYDKAERLKSYKEKAEAEKKEIKKLKKTVKDKTTEVEEAKGYIGRLKSHLNDIEDALDKIPKSPDFTSNKAWKELDKKISKLKETVANEKPDEEAISKLNGLKAEANSLTEYIGAVKHNKDIEIKIEELRAERKQSEINRANAEKILDQVDRFKKHKNDKLSEVVNSHFKIAQFRLFKVLKNGNIEDACDVLIDGKEITSQANQSLQVLALVDIVSGLQEFFNQHVPVFLDNHALFTSETDAKIDLNTQTIKLIAADGVAKLRVEEG